MDDTLILYAPSTPLTWILPGSLPAAAPPPPACQALPSQLPPLAGHLAHLAMDLPQLWLALAAVSLQCMPQLAARELVALLAAFSRAQQPHPVLYAEACR